MLGIGLVPVTRVLLALSASALALPRGLEVATDAPGRLAGRLHASVAPAAFEARALGPGTAAASIELDGLRVDVTLDLGTALAVLDGRGEVSIQERLALQRLAGTLERYLEPHARALPLHEALLLAATQLMSEAPVGLRLSHVEIPAPRRGAAAAGRTGAAGASCQAADNDGIAYLDGGCALQLHDDICHDALGACFACEVLPNGCSVAQGCPGRCGAGCGLFGGRGSYTRDCAEHDRCCTLHGQCANPLSFDCGDEFWEAADDVLWGWLASNCPQGCPAS
jgi:hypothetical protein